MFECDPEFVLSGSESSVCQSDGSWSEIQPVCEPVGKYTYLPNSLLRPDKNKNCLSGYGSESFRLKANICFCNKLYLYAF